MNQKYTDDQKQSIIDQFERGESVVSLISATGIPRSTIYAWLKSAKEKDGKQEISLRSYRNLEAKVKRLEGIIKILQTVNCRMDNPLKVKLNALEE